jgi:tetratricopeptide (TPR) repeat protein
VADAHAVVGYNGVFYEWNWAESDREFQRSLALDPENANTHHWHGGTLLSRGRYDAAIAEGRRAVALDPVSAAIRVGLANMFFFARRYDEAIEACQQALELEPGFMPAHILLAVTYYSSGRVDQAVAESRRLVELGSPRSSVSREKLCRGRTARGGGDTRDATARSSQTVPQRSRSDRNFLCPAGRYQ